MAKPPKAPAKPKRPIGGNSTPPIKSWWKPGQSGNPAGRPPKDKCLTQIITQMMEQECSEQKGKTWAQVVAEATLRLAIKGNAAALKEVWDRVDGKVPQHLDLQGTEGLVQVDVGTAREHLTRELARIANRKTAKDPPESVQ